MSSSTTMVVEGAVINVPSDATGERPIRDALLVIPGRDFGGVGSTAVDRGFRSQ
jgi:hypothetical protein